MTILIQSDVRHECKVPMWYCSLCKQDYCGEEPKFCPNCGTKFTGVSRKKDDS